MAYGVGSDNRKTRELPDKLTLRWLLDNLSWTAWTTLVTIVVGAFSFGALAPVQSLLGAAAQWIVPRHTNNVPESTLKNFDDDVASLVRDHDARLKSLQDGIIKEVSLSSGTDGILHAEAANDLREDLAKENESFKSALSSVRAAISEARKESSH